MSKKKIKKGRLKPKAYYQLSEVRQYILKGKVRINPNARRDAYRCFGWESEDIIDAILKLQPKYYYKTDASRINPENVIDYYKAKGLKGENVYIHYYIDDESETLIINSFKEI